MSRSAWASTRVPVALLPLARTIDTEFERGPRVPTSEVLHWDT
ncbi:hypothetical protein [Embleya sp. AB8]